MTDCRPSLPILALCGAIALAIALPIASHADDVEIEEEGAVAPDATEDSAPATTPEAKAADEPPDGDPAPGAETALEDKDPAEMSPDEARLAVEEAELRERMITALAIAESVRLRGRTILVAMTEISRVRRSVQKLPPLSDERAAFEARLRRLEQRRIALDREVTEEFESYLAIVSELASDLWPRLNRVGDQVAEGLKERRLARLLKLYPLLHSHIEEYNRLGSVTRGITERWRAEIDDTYLLRREKLDSGPPPEPSVTEPNEQEEEDI